MYEIWKGSFKKFLWIPNYSYFFNGKGGLTVHWIEKLLGFENGLTYLIRHSEYGWICNLYYMFCDCLWTIGAVFQELLSTLVGKNPDVDTSFLPDRDREEEENKLR